MRHRSLFVFATLATAVAAQGVNCTLLGTHNQHAPYANVWGYVAPNGKEYALLGANSGTVVVDVSNPANPIERGFIPGANSTWRELNTYQQYCYVSTEAGGAGIQVIDLTNPDQPVLANTFGTAQLNNCHTITCDTQTGRIYCNGTNNGTAVFDASVNRTNPTFVGYMTPSGQSNYFHDFHTRNGFGYASMIYNGVLRIYDLSVWPPVALSSVSTPNTFTHNAWTNAGSTVCATTDERTASFVKFWDISNRNAPVGLSQYTTNPVSIPHNAYILGNLCHVSWYTEGYVLLDITDPTQPVEIASYDTWPGASGGFNGAWGVYPFLPSGNVLILDISTGLYVVRPHITDLVVDHTPLAETSDEDGPYVVTATATGSNPVTGMTVQYRVGNSGPFTAVPMVLAGGVWSGSIPGQNAVATVQYHIEAADTVAARRLPRQGEYEFLVGTRAQVFFDDCEIDRGWTHGFTAGADDWQRGVPRGLSGTSGGVPWADPGTAFSGTQVWANDLGGTGFNGSYPNSTSNWLQSPAIPTQGIRGLHLRYRRWLTLAAADTVRVLVNGTVVFTTSSAVNDTSWLAVDHDVSAILDNATTATVRFELTSNATNVSGGWTLDDIELVALSDQAPPRLYGVGTPGTGGLVPTLGLSASARLGTTIQLQGGSLLPAAGAFVLLNLLPDNTPVAGMQLLVAPTGAATFFQVTSAGGTLAVPFQVPNSMVYDNLYFFAQVAGLDPGAASGPLSASRGLRFRIHRN
jgi:choice-of-anchor B domain-containing protein